MSNDILGATVRLLTALCPDFLGVVKDLLEKLSGESRQTWFVELKRFLRKEACWLPNILRIDRSVKFDPAKFLGEGWKIDEEDERSLTLAEVDLVQIRLEHMLKDGEDQVRGETKLERLKKAGHVRLDARIFQILWENQNLIPESWKEKTNGNTTFTYFDGTILLSPDGYRYVLYLYWRDGQWHWNVLWLENGWYRHRPSAVLAKPARPNDSSRSGG